MTCVGCRLMRHPFQNRKLVIPVNDLEGQPVDEGVKPLTQTVEEDLRYEPSHPGRISSPLGNTS